jgi:hypothetical protein
MVDDLEELIIAIQDVVAHGCVAQRRRDAQCLLNIYYTTYFFAEISGINFPHDFNRFFLCTSWNTSLTYLLSMAPQEAFRRPHAKWVPSS